MTKVEWEVKHRYGQSEHCCSYCKRATREDIDPWTSKYYCSEKEKSKAGKATNASFCCDLFEHI